MKKIKLPGVPDLDAFLAHLGESQGEITSRLDRVIELLKLLVVAQQTERSAS